MSDEAAESKHSSSECRQREFDDASSSSCSSSSSSESNRPRESDWKPVSKAVVSVHEAMIDGLGARDIIRQLVPNAEIDHNVNDSTLWRVIVNLLTEPPVRSKLPAYNTFDDAVQLLRASSKIVVLTGAGVSVSCGIPDFRSHNGIYARLRREFPDLPNPEAMFDLEYFKRNPRPFYEFAREIFPGQYQPSLCHRFVRELERSGKLLRNYTQNIDLLERIAGTQRVVYCHGSFATASCCACKYNVECGELKEAIFDKKIPRCPRCPADTELNFMKPDIVFFGEELPDQFHELFTADKEQVDLLIVIGSSLKVRPVALVPNCVPPHVPQILINREPLQHLNFDIELLGNCDTIVSELCRRLNDQWTERCNGGNDPLREVAFNSDNRSSSESELQRIRELKRSRSLEPTPSSKRARIVEQQTPSDAAGRNTDDDGTAMDDRHKRRTPDIEELRKMYKPRLRNLASELEDNTYFHVAPNRYVFPGAEVYTPWDDNEDDDDDDDDDDDGSSASSRSPPASQTDDDLLKSSDANIDRISDKPVDG